MIRIVGNVKTASTARADRAIVRATFNSAAAAFDAEPLFFWEPCGRRTVELAGIGSGSRVLDVCCGAGASALEAARRVGRAGRVVGIDLADRLLELARRKAVRSGLGNVEFRSGDMTHLEFPDRSFDAVVCVFGFYFARDLPGAARELWRLVRPGGTLAVTTWGTRALEPFHSVLFDALEAERPDLRPPSVSWERINTAEALTGALRAGGVVDPVVVSETLVREWDGRGAWTMVLGSGYRLVVDVLGSDASERVRADLERRLEERPPCAITSDILFARARRP